MTSRKIFFAAVICALAYRVAFAQNSALRLEPGQLLFQAIQPPQVCQNESPIRISVLSPSQEWSVSCMAEAAVLGEHCIGLDRILLKKEGEEAFQPMLSTIHIGGGEPAEAYQDISLLHFQSRVLETDPVGTYNGLIRFKLINENDPFQSEAEAVLPLTIEIHPHITLDLAHQNNAAIHITGTPGMYDAENPLSLSVSGNTDSWQITATYQSSQGQDAFNGKIFVSSSGLPEYQNQRNEGAGAGYACLYPYRTCEILNGISSPPPWQTDLNFRVNTSAQIAPGSYPALIKIEAPGYDLSEYIQLDINVNEYLAIELSDNQVNIKSSGPPGEYIGDRDVVLRVASNTEKWEAIAEGENLKSSNDEIPAERVYIHSSNQIQQGYMPLNTRRTVASGTRMNMMDVSTLKFKVQTTWHDVAGEYNGKVYFTVIALSGN
ncbi:hypothetical protein JXJ21_25695 [candidate division KSB1 bacterium]|nr:hypothetical protein [candidate division KSB1 bacterium]